MLWRVSTGYHIFDEKFWMSFNHDHVDTVVCSKWTQCVPLFETNTAVCSKWTECLPEANTELHSDLELLVIEQDNLKAAITFIDVLNV